MSLSKQFILLISILVLLVFAGTLSINIHNSRKYLDEQMRSHAQDTATSLGLSITQPMSTNDTAMINTMVDAIFDRGYYQDMIIRNMSGVVLLERRLNVEYKNVPQWFINAFPLSTPEAKTTITSGWNQIATLHVRSHPGYAYRELWLTSVQNFWWLLCLAAASILAAMFITRLILKPLRLVESQALAISAREFPIQKNIPRTPELGRVTRAMNQMTAKVAKMLSSQTELTEKMRARAYEDPVTGLHNRRGFEERLKHLTKATEEFRNGAVIITRLDNFKQYNEEKGYQQGDELLRQVGATLQNIGEDINGLTLARASGAEFAIIVPNITPDEASEIANTISSKLASLNIEDIARSNVTIHSGIAWFDGSQSASELLSTADLAVQTARLKGANSWYIQDQESLDSQFIRSASQWKKVLTDCITNNRISLYRQNVQSLGTDSSISHHEVLARLNEGESIIPAGIFIPMAERHGLATEIDKLVIANLLGLMDSNSDILYAINLSPSSVLDRQFIEWLCEQLSQHKDIARKLIFETSENGIVSNIEELEHAIASIQNTGSQFSLDHFGVGTKSFGYLHNLKVDYIKIDGSYIRHIDQNEDNEFFVRCVTDIAHGLDIKVIAEFVETEAEIEVLRKLDVDGAQGYLVGDIDQL